jgi:GNAT superfamily N-acetyltransferase
LSAPVLADVTGDPRCFFESLPEDWRAEIESCWAGYASSSRVYALREEDVVIGGGIVFRKPAPDTLVFAARARALFERGLLYIGFLYLDPARRGRDLGSFWIDEVRARHPGRHFWLAIEAPGLRRFYERNGFAVVDTVTVDGATQWILSDASRKLRAQELRNLQPAGPG